MAGAFDGAPVIGVEGGRATEGEMPDQVGHDRRGTVGHDGRRDVGNDGTKAETEIGDLVALAAEHGLVVGLDLADLGTEMPDQVGHDGRGSVGHDGRGTVQIIRGGKYL